jgi:hypothetical protein
VPAAASDSRTSSPEDVQEQHDDEDDNENIEEDLSDTGGGTGDSAEAQGSSYECDNQRDDRVIEKVTSRHLVISDFLSLKCATPRIVAMQSWQYRDVRRAQGPMSETAPRPPVTYSRDAGEPRSLPLIQGSRGRMARRRE